MRYSIGESTYILGHFSSGDTVTITIYKLSDNSVVVSGDSCTEIGSTGVFKYNFSQSLSSKEEFLWIMSNGNLQVMGKIVLGGYPDDIMDKTNNLPSDPASQSQVESVISTVESNIRGSDSDDLKVLSDQLDSVQADLNNPDQFKADVSSLALQSTLEEVKSKTDTINWSDVTKILQIESGRWKIENNQMIFYDSDGTTPLLTFNLYDENGNATSDSVYERVPV